MAKDAFKLTLPDVQSTSVIFASPHSGRDYPWSFLRRSELDELAIRSSEDAFMDMLIASAPSCGAALLAARMPRAFLDLNRASDELDPAVIEGVHQVSHNPRIASGLGVIPRVVSNGRAIYRGKLKLSEAHARISEYWRPYHDQLAELMSDTRRDFGEAILIDCHSMPHEAVDAVTQSGLARPEVVLGDRFGASADSAIVERIETIFLEAGLRVSRNAPFAGAFTTQHYGRPSRRQHAVQIEIDRSLYMNEMRVRPNGNFDNFRALMTRVVAEISEIGRKKLRVAAE
ncbi:N-formylglutamate amidohydrolase [uncultured Litoreibacter sp.]|uniref:N-formylglutamate amidohydrolase n=1 Tax=uncultured Litoreibacter sp. TaxID=1392394 RepID=UPI00261F3333|nr:N-formylglutamate amidohydrolase [uncultured Litoreibacter sp.]